MNDIDKYQTWAKSIWVTPDTDVKDQIVHALLGLTTEVGEIADLYKKPWFTPHRLNKVAADPDKWFDDLTKELGDVLYYLVVLAEIHQINMSDVLKTNIEKLEARYGAASKD